MPSLRNITAMVHAVIPTPNARDRFSSSKIHRRKLALESLESRWLPALIIWDGGAGTFNWNDAANWSTNSLPGSSDDVLIPDLPGSPTITIPSGNHTVSKIESLESITISGGSLTVNGQFWIHQQLTLSAGTLTGPGDLTIAGTMTWSGGTLSGTGNTILGTGASLNIPNSVNAGGRPIDSSAGAVNWTSGTISGTFNNSGPLYITGSSNKLASGSINQSGPTTWTGTGHIYFNNQAVFNNLPGSTFEIQNNASMAVYAGSSQAFNNQGTLKKSAGTASSISIPLINSGILDASVDNIVLTANASFNTGSAISGPGSVQFTSGVTINAAMSASNILFSGGTLTGPGDLTIASTMIWSGGTLSGTGNTILAPGAALIIQEGNATAGGRPLDCSVGAVNWTSGTISGTFNNSGPLYITGSSNKLASGTINQSGPTTWTGTGHIYFNNDAVFNNLPGSTFEIQNNASMAVYAGSSQAFNNQGTLKKSAGTATSISIPLNNSGTILIETGALNINVKGTWLLDDQDSIHVLPSASITIPDNLIGTTTNRDQFQPLGLVTLSGGGNATNPQLLEVMSRDLGNSSEGFLDNFAYGSLALNSTYVRLIDNANNAPGEGGEALYVNSLNVPTGSTLDLNGKHLFVRTVEVNGSIVGGTFSRLNAGGPLAFGLPTVAQIQAQYESHQWTVFGRAGHEVTLWLNPGSSSAPTTVAPFLNFARITLLDPSNNPLATISGTTNGQILTLASVPLPADGLYTIQVQASPSQPTSTGNYLLSAWDATPDLNPLELNSTFWGHIETPFSVDRWTFAAGMNSQVRLDILNRTSPSIVFDLTGPNGWSGFTGLTADSGLITLPHAGTYTLTARGTGGIYGGSYAARIDLISQTDLALDSLHHGQLHGSADAQLFKIEVPGGTPLLVRLDDQTGGPNRNELYARLGAPPTRTAYDARYRAEGKPDQTLLVERAAPGTWYILVYGNEVPTPGPFTLRASASSVVVGQAIPETHSTIADAEITLTGAGFTPGAQVELLAGSLAYTAASVEVDSYDQLTATFSALSVPVGTYDLRATLPDGSQTTVPQAFTFTLGEPGRLETRLILPDAIGWHNIGEIRVEYKNTGASAINAPLLRVTATVNGAEGAYLTLDASRLAGGYWTFAEPEGFTPSVQFLARGKVPGLLQPGETGSIAVYYAGWKPPWPYGSQAEFQLHVTDATNADPIDWAALKNPMRPDNLDPAAWDLIYPNLIAQTGNTWGDYVRMLGQNAHFLARLGRTVFDIAELLGYEIQQAIGFTPDRTLATTTDATVPAPGADLAFGRTYLATLLDRNRLGPFGYGWTTLGPWDTRASVRPDGTIVLTSMDGHERIFQPDRRRPDAYFALPGEPARILERTSESLTLAELDGTLLTFDAQGRLIAFTDSAGNSIEATQTADRLTRLSSPSGAFLQIDYNPAGRISRVIDHLGRETHYDYNIDYTYLMTVTAVDGRVTRYDYIAGETGPRNHALAAITHPDLTQTRFDYDARGRLTAQSAADGSHAIELGYDEFGSVFLTRPPSAGQPGGTHKLVFDHAGHIAKRVDPQGRATRQDYDSFGNLTRLSDAEGRSTLAEYDALGRLTSLTNPLGQRTQLTYDGSTSRVATLTDALGRTTRYAHDPLGNLITVTDPAGRAIRYSYDVHGNLSTLTNRRAQAIAFTYDALGRVTSKTYPGDAVHTFSYDARGNLAQTTDPTGITSYQYEQQTDRLLRVETPGGRFLTFTYDAAGRRRTLADETGYTLTYHYDFHGRLDAITDSQAHTLLDHEHDAAGLLTRATLGNGIFSTYEYNAQGRPLAVRHFLPDGSPLAEFTYSYDPRGLITFASTPAGDWQYRYDDLGQLSGWTDPLNQVVDLFYDAAGNRARTTANGQETLYSVNLLNQYTTLGTNTYQYDVDGNLVRSSEAGVLTSYIHDAENRLISLARGADAWSYAYDALGNPVLATAGGQAATRVFDPLNPGLILIEYQAGNLFARNLAAAAAPFARALGGTTHYLTFDALGHAAALTGPGGSPLQTYNYSPFGQTTTPLDAALNPYRFAPAPGARELIPGLFATHTRAYHAGLGRFITSLPATSNPAAPNPYTFAANNPLQPPDLPGWTDAPIGNGAADRPTPRLIPHIPTPAATPAPAPSPTPTIGSTDPNQKTGPRGYGPGAFVPTQGDIPYRIEFENLGPGTIPTPRNPATAPAQRVVITDQLSPDLDWSTFAFKGFGFYDVHMLIPELLVDASHHAVILPVTQGGYTFQLHVDLEFNTQTGVMHAVFQSIDPATQLPPPVLVGFLPPEDGTGRGKGYLDFTVQPRPGLPTGRRIPNIASIQFDSNPIITTNQIDAEDPTQGTSPDREAAVTIDAGPPASSSILPLPAFSPSTSFFVSWTGSDDPGGSGIAAYDVDYRANAGPWLTWLKNTPLTTEIFTGLPSTTYTFRVTATDGVGNRQPTPTEAQASITTGDLDLELAGTPETLEGSTYTLHLAASGTGADMITTWIIDWGDGSTSDLPGNPAAAPHLFRNGPLPAIIRARALIQGQEYPASTLPVQVRNAPPTVDAGPDALVIQGGTFSSAAGKVYDPGAPETFTATVDYGDGSGPQPLTIQPDRTFTLNHTYTTPGAYTVTVQVRDSDIGQDSLAIEVLDSSTVGPRILSITPTPAGARVLFDRALDPAVLSLIDNQASALGPADVTLRDALGEPVPGSIVLSTDQRTLEWIRTGSPLQPGNYQLALRGADNGIRDTTGTAFDGDGDDTAGGTFAWSFSVGQPPARLLSLPDLVRGPGQTIGLPITLSSGAAVHAVDFRLKYEPALLQPESLVFSPAVPAAWDLLINSTTPGEWVVSASGPAPLSNGPGLQLFTLQASVPSTAPYASKQVIQLAGLSVSDALGNPLHASADDAVHLVAYPGDNSGNGTVTAVDVTFLRRVIVGLDSGFIGYQMIDPTLVADFNTSASLTAGDVTILRRFLTGLSQSSIPSINTGITITPSGLDPFFSLPRNLAAKPGDIIRVPLNFLQTDSVAIPWFAFDAAIQFDPRLLTLLDVQPGDLSPADEFLVDRSLTPGQGIVTLSAAALESVSLDPGTSGTLAWLTFRVNANARPGSSLNLNLLHSADHPTRGAVQTLANEGTLILLPSPTNAPDDPTDGRIAIRVRGIQRTSASAAGLTVPVVFDSERSGLAAVVSGRRPGGLSRLRSERR